MYKQNNAKYVLTSPLTGNRLKHWFLIVSQNEKLRECTKFVFAFGIYIDKYNFRGTSAVIDAVKTAFVYGPYNEHMLKFTNIREYCIVGIFTLCQDMFIFSKESFYCRRENDLWSMPKNNDSFVNCTTDCNTECKSKNSVMFLG